MCRRLLGVALRPPFDLRILSEFQLVWPDIRATRRKAVLWALKFLAMVVKSSEWLLTWSSGVRSTWEGRGMYC